MKDSAQTQTPKKILLVEDDRVLAEALESKLKREGYEVSLASNGKEALLKLSEIVPDLLILDLLLPEVHGLDVLAQIRKQPDWQALPVIVLTVMPEETAYRKATELGVTEYLVKTEYTPSQICNLVKLILEEEEKLSP